MCHFSGCITFIMQWTVINLIEFAISAIYEYVKNDKQCLFTLQQLLKG